MRAEREGEFALHLYACNEMMPYFFAAGHYNYARYGLCYLRVMERFSNDVLKSFMKGEHVMRHQDGLFNSIWSDMAIETTCMKFGKGPSGIGTSRNLHKGSHPSFTLKMSNFSLGTVFLTSSTQLL